MRSFLFAVLALMPSVVFADAAKLRAIVVQHVLPQYQLLAEETQRLSNVANESCASDETALKAAYHAAFDAWIGVSHLRFGPSEQQDRAFAIAFWPDPRGSTPKALAALIRDNDQAVFDADEFAAVSIAARGFYALEYLLFDQTFADTEPTEYRCALIQAIARDLSSNAAAIVTDWSGGYGDLIAEPGNDTYRTQDEATRQFFTALSTGLEFTSQTRLGRPLGAFDRPRPKRAEARRSGRSLRHVGLSLAALQDLGMLITGGDTELARAFEAAIARADALKDPVFADVSAPQSRFRIEALQQAVEDIRTLLSEDVGPALGIAAGFNSLDGD